MLRSAATPNRTLGASESEMEHTTIRRCQPMPAAPAADSLALRRRRKTAPEANRARLFRA